MRHIVVEYKDNGIYKQKVVAGDTKIEHGDYPYLLGVWHCVSMEECHVMQEQLREMRHVRSS
jgi:hypothetical protein